MTPSSFLDFVAEIRGFRGADKKQRVERCVEKTSLQKVLSQPIDTLSKGFKRRVGLAQAILHDPEVLVLDEPTDGLDPNQKHEVRTLIRSMAKDKAIVLSTHILEEVDAVCSRVIIIADGMLKVDCTPDELAARARTHNAVALSVVAEQADTITKSLDGMDGVAAVERESSRNGRVGLLVVAKDRRPIVGAISQRARDDLWDLEELHVEHGRLDDVFRELTGTGGSN
jgi:ABC-2 type transport system ATP-binding protein